jgi:DNA-binding NarL/FixJ family response regulator
VGSAIAPPGYVSGKAPTVTGVVYTDRLQREGATVARARILLADDHRETRDRVVNLLEPEFDMLEPVADGRALLDRAAELNPDVCLLDISMPIVDGIEAAVQLKESGSTAKIVFLTIHGDQDFVQAALQTGAFGYVVKPRMVSDLSIAIRKALAGRVFISPTIDKRRDHFTYLDR